MSKQRKYCLKRPKTALFRYWLLYESATEAKRYFAPCG